MYTLEEAQQLINKHIENIKFPEEPAELYDPVRYILSLGGKRIRPSLVLMACEMFDGSVASALHPATAIEIFHNFTLVHDDIMDKSDMRRGNQTIHKKWDENVAILSGDVMSILASRLLNESPGAVLHQVNDVFTHTAMQVCEGQQLDMNFEHMETVSEDEYLKMIELKTAVLIAASLKIGAMLGGSSEKDAEDLYDFGRELGIAFQLQDDLLDTYGDVAVFGKKTGLDIVDNKKTILMVTALKDGTKQQEAELLSWLGKKEFEDEEKINAVKAIYEDIGIKEKVKKMIILHYESALESLEHLNVPDGKKGELLAFASYLMEREK